MTCNRTMIQRPMSTTNPGGFQRSQQAGRQRHPLLLALVLAGLGQVGCAGTAQGQATSPYDALGLRLGAFTLFPTLTVSEVYESNVELAAEDEQSDFVTSIQPALALRSGWSVHRLELATGANIAVHANESDEDYEDLFARATGRIDVRRSTTVDISADVERLHVGRDDPEDDGNDLVYYISYGSAIQLNRQFNRLTLSGDVAVERDDFDDEEDDRDVTLYDAGLRSSYRIGRGLDLFVEGRYNIEDRDQDIDDGGFERDSRGYELRLGASEEINALLSGELFVGYRLQQFDEPTFDDESGLSFGADLTWQPTQLTTVGLAATRTLNPTDQAGATSNFETGAALSLAHELRRNITLTANLGYTQSDFSGDARADDTIEGGVGAIYRMNRWIGLNAGYDYRERNSTDDNEDFQAHRVQIGLGLQF